MTEGHRHRLVTVRYDGPVMRALRVPLLHRTDVARVERSPYPYGPCPKRDGVCPGHHGCWVLTPLGILHRWTGLTLYYETPDEGASDDHRGG